MRRVVLCLLGAFVAQDASAADYLRGSSYDAPPPAAIYHWGGVYIGGQVGYGQSESRFDTTDRSAFVSALLRPTIEPSSAWSQWPALDKADTRGGSYGGFIGYNSQWGEAVFGVEVNYSRSALKNSSERTTYVDTSSLAGGAPSVSQITYRGDMTLTDMLSGRLRAGYAINWAMPYGFIGAAIGRADLVRSATVSYAANVNPAYIPYTDTQTRNGAILAGYTAGFGVDIGLMPNLFLRGEYEFAQFSAVDGVDAQVNTVRAAAAVKF